MEEDLYKILGVSKSSELGEIKKTYRKIARDNHPDLNPDDKAAEERFKKASVAFEVLSDTDKRALYDEFGLDGLREGFNADQARQYAQWGGGGGGGQRRYSSNSAGFEDIFGNIFGGPSPFESSGFGDFYGGPVKGQDIEAAMTLDFMTAVQGGEFDIKVGGKLIKVRIPAGASDGGRLRLKGQGQPPPGPKVAGSKSGDLLLTMNVKDHKLLRREKLHLYLDLPVTIAEAIHGAKVAVPTPHGEYKVTIPSGVNSGAKLRLKGKGVHRGKKQGDFYVIIQIHTPDRIDEDLEAHADAISEGYSTDIRAELEL